MRRLLEFSVQVPKFEMSIILENATEIQSCAVMTRPAPLAMGVISVPTVLRPFHGLCHAAWADTTPCLLYCSARREPSCEQEDLDITALPLFLPKCIMEESFIMWYLNNISTMPKSFPIPIEIFSACMLSCA